MTLVEICGMPRAGKTTLLKNMEKYLINSTKSYDIIKRPDIKFKEVGGLYSFHTMYIDMIDKAIHDYHSNPKDLLLFDRGPNDRSVFLFLDMQQGHISKDFYTSSISRLDKIIENIDYTFMLMVGPEESFRRWPSQIEEGLDNQHLNIGMPSYDTSMKKMSMKYAKYLELGLTNPNIILVDCERSREEVFSKVLNTLKDANTL
jgi:thymidylate kinase